MRIFAVQLNMVPIVQLVRASDCGSECRGFESHWAPKSNFERGCFFLCSGVPNPQGFVRIDEVITLTKEDAAAKVLTITTLNQQGSAFSPTPNHLNSYISTTYLLHAFMNPYST